MGANSAIGKVEAEDITQLERELRKHQQANEAFQKALKEIGTIITNVANGNLNQKVEVHLVEMDPEITNFKKTINIDKKEVPLSDIALYCPNLTHIVLLGEEYFWLRNFSIPEHINVRIHSI